MCKSLMLAALLTAGITVQGQCAQGDSEVNPKVWTD